ncbi:hypothetical protein ES703_82297 [subsurface metagenome]
MNFKSVEELQEKLKQISNKGFIKTHRQGNTGNGKTLEDEMNITENNNPKGDFKIGKKDVELKTQRTTAKNRVTLFTKEPVWNRNKHEIVNKTGYIDKKGRKGLKVILTTKGFNPKKYKLAFKGFWLRKRIAIIHEVEGEVCSFKLGKLLKIIMDKLDNLLFVESNMKKINGIEHFHYNKATYYVSFKRRMFRKMINNGEIVWEFRLHMNSKTNIRDRGSGFRINEKLIPKLYKSQKVIL